MESVCDTIREKKNYFTENTNSKNEYFSVYEFVKSIYPLCHEEIFVKQVSLALKRVLISN